VALFTGLIMTPQVKKPVVGLNIIMLFINKKRKYHDWKQCTLQFVSD
jgi:hypothetical protein